MGCGWSDLVRGKQPTAGAWDQMGFKVPADQRYSMIPLCISSLRKAEWEQDTGGDGRKAVSIESLQ